MMCNKTLCLTGTSMTPFRIIVFLWCTSWRQAVTRKLTAKLSYWIVRGAPSRAKVSGGQGCETWLDWIVPCIPGTGYRMPPDTGQ